MCITQSHNKAFDNFIIQEFHQLFGEDEIIKLLIEGTGMTSQGRINRTALCRHLHCSPNEFSKRLALLKEKLKLAGFANE